MRKLYIGFIIFLLVYGIFISLYLLHTEQALPDSYIGSPADPTTFMSVEHLEKATSYSRTKDILFFLGIPWEWAIYLLILGLGFTSTFSLIAKKISKKNFLTQAGVYTLLLSTFVALLKFPLQYYSYKVSQEYGISIQPFDLWLADKGKGWLIDAILTIPAVWLLYFVIKKSPKRWWLYFWLLTIPLTIMLYFLQPVVIDPVFNKFQPLQDQVLKEEILGLADRAEIPTEQVFEVKMSEKTTAMNAYVTGIASNARIVLWDTTLQKLEKDEILFIMAHEMGHYVYRHVYWMIFGSIISSFFLAYLVYRLVNWLIDRYGHHWDIKNISSINSLPLLLLILSLLSFILSPLENTISRQSERAADAYAIQMTGNEQAAITSFQKLAKEGLSEPNPPAVVKFFLYRHPTLAERIYTVVSTSSGTSE